MAKETKITCDAPGCSRSALNDDTAGALLGWVTRVVTDHTRKLMVDGVRSHSAFQTQHLCPRHAKEADELDAPETHPDVVAWIDQKESGLGTDQ